MRGHRQDSAQKWGLPCRWLFLFFLGKNRCETDLCSKQMGGEIHQMTVSKNAMMHCVSKFWPNGKGNATILTVWLRCFWCHPVTIRWPSKHAPGTKKGEWHAAIIEKSKTGVGSIPGSMHRTAQLQRTLPPLHPLLQAKFSHHCGGLSPLRKQAKRKVLKSAPNRRNFRRSVAVMKVSAAEINAPHTRRKQQNTHPFPTEKVPIESYLTNGANRQETTQPSRPINI